MNPDPLPLRDIHLPPAPSWWPPAPGWWGLLLLVLLGALLLFWWRQRQRRLALQRRALQELRRIATAHAGAADAGPLAQQLSMLLRRVSLSRFPRAETAGLTGEAWLQWLDRQQGGDGFQRGAGRALIEAPYRRHPALDGSALLALCEGWLRQVTRPGRDAP